MKWLARALMVVLVAALVTTAVSWVLDQTTWNAGYVQTMADQTDLAAKLAANLPAVAAAYAPGPVTRQAVAQVVNEDYVSRQLHTVIPGLVEAYRHDGVSPRLNLTDIGQQLQLAGIAVPANLSTLLASPQPVVPQPIDALLRTVGRTTGELKWLAPLVAALAAALLLVLGRRRRWLLLAESLAVAAVVTVIAAIGMQLPPHLVGATLDNSAAHPLVPAIRGFLAAVANDQTHRLFIIAAVMGLAALILGVIHLVASSLHRLRKPHKPSPETDSPEN